MSRRRALTHHHQPNRLRLLIPRPRRFITAAGPCIRPLFSHTTHISSHIRTRIDGPTHLRRARSSPGLKNLFCRHRCRQRRPSRTRIPAWTLLLLPPADKPNDWTALLPRLLFCHSVFSSSTPITTKTTATAPPTVAACPIAPCLAAPTIPFRRGLEEPFTRSISHDRFAPRLRRNSRRRGCNCPQPI